MERLVAELQEQQAEKQREIQQANNFISKVKQESPENYQAMLDEAHQLAEARNLSVDEALLELVIAAIRESKTENDQTDSTEPTAELEQQLRETAIQLKDQLEANEPEQFQALQTAAKEVAEQQEIEIAEAMIVMLMQAIDEQKKG